MCPICSKAGPIYRKYAEIFGIRKLVFTGRHYVLDISLTSKLTYFNCLRVENTITKVVIEVNKHLFKNNLQAWRSLLNKNKRVNSLSMFRYNIFPGIFVWSIIMSDTVAACYLDMTRTSNNNSENQPNKPGWNTMYLDFFQLLFASF